MQCFYKTLDLLPSATDNEIRSAYRRRALSTHPDKGGSPEAFRAVVFAFETLSNSSRRSAYDQLRLQPRQTAVSSAPPPRSRKRAAPSRTPTSSRAAKAETPRQRTPAPAPQPAADAANDPLDSGQFFRRLLRMPNKQALAELRQLSEEALNAFAAFLASDAESILSERPVLALKDRSSPRGPKPTKPRTDPAKKQNPSSRESKLVKGITCNRRDRSYQARMCLRGFATMTQYVKNLDLAVDMHISLVQMQQYASQGLTEGKDFGTAIQDAIELVQKERAASGALALRLRFRSFFKQSCSLTEHKLDQAIRDWENLSLRKGAAAQCQESAAKQQEQKERQERREAAREERAKQERQKAERRNAREMKQELLRSKRQAFARRKLRSFQAFVEVRQAHFEKLRKKQFLKTWGVPELPEGLQLISFQGPDDSLCAMLRLSDGRLQAGPYRKSLQEALRDLHELRVIQQRKGDEVLCEEMHRRDAEAMTAFFVQSLNRA